MGSGSHSVIAWLAVQLGTYQCEKPEVPSEVALTKAIRMLKLLIKHGLDPNKINPGWTSTAHPLHMALHYSNSAEIVELLLKAGADPQAINCSSGLTALEIAKNKGDCGGAAQFKVLNEWYNDRKGILFSTCEKRLKVFDKNFLKYKMAHPTNIIFSHASFLLSNRQPPIVYPSLEKWSRVASKLGNTAPILHEAIRNSIQDIHTQKQSLNTLCLDLRVIDKILPVLKHNEVRQIFIHEAENILKTHRHQMELAQEYIGKAVPAFTSTLNKATQKLTETIGNLSSEKNPAITALSSLLAMSKDFGISDIQEVSEVFLNKVIKIPDVVKDLNDRILEAQNLLQGLKKNPVSMLEIFKATAMVDQFIAEKKKYLAGISHTFADINQGVELLGTLVGMSGNSKLAQQVVAVAQAGINIANTLTNFGSIAAASGPLAPYVMIGGAVFSIFESFGLFGGGPSKEKEMLMQISQQISELGQHIDKRFDRVELMLSTIHQEMHQRFDRIHEDMNKHFEMIQGMLNQSYTDMMSSFKALNEQQRSTQEKLNIVHEATKRIEDQLHQGFEALYTRKYQGKRDKYWIYRRNFPNDPIKDKKLKMNYYSPFLAWTTIDVKNPLVAENGQLKKLDVFCDDIAKRGWESSINAIAAYIKQEIALTIPIPLANSIVWSEGACNFMRFVDTSHELILTPEQEEGINEMIRVGQDISDFIFALRSSEKLFISLCEQYRVAARAVIAALKGHDNIGNIGRDISMLGSPLASTLKDFNTVHNLLVIMVEVAFNQELNEDEAFNNHIRVFLWSKADFEHYMESIDSPQIKEFMILAMERNALTAIDNLENLLLEKVLDTKHNQHVCYPLVDNVLKELKAFSAFYFSETYLQLPIIEAEQHYAPSLHEKEKPEKEKEREPDSAKKHNRNRLFSQFHPENIFVEAELQANLNNSSVVIIFDNLNEAKRCRELLRDKWGIVDKNNTNQPRKISILDDSSFAIRLSANEYDNVAGQGKYDELVKNQNNGEVTTDIKNRIVNN